MNGIDYSADDVRPVFVSPRPAVQAQAAPRVLTTDEASTRQVLRALRGAAGLKERELAERMAIPQQSVNVVLTGETKRPTLWWVVRFVTACGGRVLVEFPK